MKMQPNLILITIDALRADAVSPLGSPHNQTPTLDRLASRGVLFTQAITNGDHTKVAFPALLTSTYASMYTGCQGPLSPQRPALASLLRDVGYHTAAVIASPLLGREYGYDRGFEEFCQLEPDKFGAHWYRRKGMQWLLRKPLSHRLLQAVGVDTRMPPLYVNAEHVTDTALHLMQKLVSPFFLWVHYMDTHWPYHLESTVRDAVDLAQAWSDLNATYRCAQTRTMPHRAIIERLRNLYYLALQQVDDQIGRLLKSLTHAGHLEKTFIVVTSDHGEGFFEHGVFGHAYLHLYNEILHVPLIIYAPGETSGQIIHTPVQLMDLPPTFLDLAGIEAPEAMLGQSLVQLLKNQSFEKRPYLISEAVGSRLVWAAVTAERYKLIWAPAEPNNYELYDLVEDPDEQVNLRGRLPEVEQELLAIAQKHRAFVEASQEEASESLELEDSIVQRLRALGYLD